MADRGVGVTLLNDLDVGEAVLFLLIMLAQERHMLSADAAATACGMARHEYADWKKSFSAAGKRIAARLVEQE